MRKKNSLFGVVLFSMTKQYRELFGIEEIKNNKI